jgi:hypothetical protein
MTQRPRVFTRSGVAAHLLKWNASPNSNDSALCGHSPWPNYWLGTGSQREHERVTELPTCKRCTRAANSITEENRDA